MTNGMGMSMGSSSCNADAPNKATALSAPRSAARGRGVGHGRASEFSSRAALLVLGIVLSRAADAEPSAASPQVNN